MGIDDNQIKIKVNLSADPRIDPNSPEFGLQAWEASMLQFEEHLTTVRQRLSEIVEQILL